MPAGTSYLLAGATIRAGKKIGPNSAEVASTWTMNNPATVTATINGKIVVAGASLLTIAGSGNPTDDSVTIPGAFTLQSGARVLLAKASSASVSAMAAVNDSIFAYAGARITLGGTGNNQIPDSAGVRARETGVVLDLNGRDETVASFFADYPENPLTVTNTATTPSLIRVTTSVLNTKFVDGPGPVTLVVAGPNRAGNSLSLASQHTGGTIVEGALDLRHPLATGTGPLTIPAGGTVYINNSPAANYVNPLGLGEPIGSGSGTGTVTAGPNGVAKTLLISTANRVFRGTLVDGTDSRLDLGITGSARQRLTGLNTYTGPTTIYGGSLEIADGSLYSGGTFPGTIEIQSTGTLLLSRSDTFGDYLANPVVAINILSSGTLDNTTTFNTIRNLSLNGGTLRASGGLSAASPPGSSRAL